MKGSTKITGAGAAAASRNTNKRNKQITFKSRTPFTECISETKDIQVEDAKGLDVVMQMNELIEYNDNYEKTSRNVGQYHKGDPNDNITDSESFKFKAKIARRTLAACNNKDVEIVVSLK